ncbi:MAG: T9SS type A sorting domain-containing protein [Parvicellaceae bacterium]
MKKNILIIALSFCLIQITKAQLITCVPCAMLGMSVNVGSQQTSISIYHSGQYMTSPDSENIFMWEFTDQQGNILYEDTLVDESTIAFGHNWSLTDTINVTVHFVNDSANLDNWYVSQGLPPNGNSINCLFEDQIYWSTGASSPWGSWTFIHNSVGVDVTNINESIIVESDFKIFPNPTSNQLNIDGPNEEYALKILNIQGQLFYEMNNIQGHQKIDVSNYPSGLYFIKLIYSNDKQTYRFIKQ